MKHPWWTRVGEYVALVLLVLNLDCCKRTGVVMCSISVCFIMLQGDSNVMVMRTFEANKNIHTIFCYWYVLTCISRKISCVFHLLRITAISADLLSAANEAIMASRLWTQPEISYHILAYMCHCIVYVLLMVYTHVLYIIWCYRRRQYE